MFKAMFRLSAPLLFLFALLPQPVVAQIAPGVTQSAAQTATITGSVIQNDGTPVAGASVQLTGPGAHVKTVSGSRGTFVFTSVPYGTYRIDAIAANLGAVSRENITVKGDIVIAIQYNAQGASGLKEIARVSTRSAGASINVTPASIASVNPSDYAFQGNTSWRELLNQIPGVTVGGDFGEGRNESVGFANGPLVPIVLSINGAQPYETSVTLDGMPLQSQSLNAAPGSGTDLSYLPMSTFDTADVVRGPGAETPTIVDSIGGSFVLHAPGMVDKNSYEFSFSNDPYGGTVENAKLALRFGRLSAMIVYGVNNSPGPLGAGGAPRLASYGFTFGTVNGQAFCAPEHYSMTNPATGLTTPMVVSGGVFHSAWTQHNGALTLLYNVTPSLTAEIFYAGTSTAQDDGSDLNSVRFSPGPSYAGSITPGMYTLDSSLFGLGAIPYSQSASLLEEKATAFIGGGVLRLAALQNTSFSHHSYNSDLVDGQYTLYGTGYYASAPSTPVTFNGTSAYLTTDFSEAINEICQADNRDFLVSYARQAGSRSSFGASYVKSYYNDPTSLLVSLPGLLFQSVSPISATSETTNELRLQGSTQISDKFSLNASWYAARGTYHVPDPTVSNCVFSFPSAVPGGYLFSIAYTQPSAYKDSTFSYSAPRLSATWRVNHDMVIRAAAGGGFALPQLGYLVGSSGIPTCGTTFCAVSLTNLNLQPEKSFGFDLGTDMRLHHDTVLSVDVYRTNLYGQIYQSVSTTGTCSTCGGLPLYISEYGNLSQTRMEGINIDIRHDVPRGMYWNGALGLTRGYVVNVPAGFYNTTSCTNCVNQYIVPGINYDGYFQSTVPYANGSATIGYRWEPGKYIDLSPTYYGNNNQYFRPAFLEFDAHAGYALTKNVSLLATFRNITGIYGQSVQTLFTCPCLTAPVIAGAPQETYGLYGMPYGPRTVIVTLNFKQ